MSLPVFYFQAAGHREAAQRSTFGLVYSPPAPSLSSADKPTPYSQQNPVICSRLTEFPVCLLNTSEICSNPCQRCRPSPVSNMAAAFRLRTTYQVVLHLVVARRTLLNTMLHPMHHNRILGMKVRASLTNLALCPRASSAATSSIIKNP